jgi:predicted phage terminase large subunit-like protein
MDTTRRGFLTMAAAMATMPMAATATPDWKAVATPVLWASTVTEGRYQTPPHVLRLNRAIIDTIRGTDGIRRLMVMMPPRHGKSELCSKYVPSWFLGVFPDRRVILTSYEATFAATWGRKSRNLLEEHSHRFRVQVASSPSAADAWDIAGHQGGMMTAGMGGAITGKGAHLLIIDDPVKNAEEANSETIREKHWDWYTSTAYTRLEPDAAQIIVQTRWHEDDLCGRILAAAADGGEPWRVLKLPALGNDGAALWPERFDADKLASIRRAIGEYYFSALYQQEPTPREGSMFMVSKLEIVDEPPSGLKMVRAWDMAATKDDGDFTAGVKMGAAGDGLYYVLDVTRGQWSTDERDSMIRLTASIDGRPVRILLPEDPGAAGKSMVAHQVRMLAGYTVRSERVTGDKITRADPFSSQVNAGNVRLVRGPWNRAFIEELRTFPRGKHDDQVDAAADAFSDVAAKKKLIVGI